MFNNKNNIKKQRGATLFTSLVFLILMTIVSVTAAKVSLVDVLVAGNNQQTMELFQETSNDLKAHADPAVLLPILQTEGISQAWVENLTDPNNPNQEETVQNRLKEYNCSGNGLATSVGPDTPPCFLFDFSVTNTKKDSSAKEIHIRGAGKEFPRVTRNNYNN